MPTYYDWYQYPTDYSLFNLNRKKIPREVKGLYVSGHTAESIRIDQLIDLLNKTELNSLVIDVKEDGGYLTYKSNVPQVKEITSDRKTFISDIDALLQKARENNIYTIARIVTFKDPFLAGAKPEIAMQKISGGVWRDSKGVSWVDPYRKEVWDYNIAIAIEAAKKGFKEIQFDYVRFPAEGRRLDREVQFNNPENKTKAEIIAEFLKYAKEQLKDYNVFISADVFGLTTTVIDDMGIGQKWELITATVDYISPMMYPSHYGKWSYGLPIPDAYPYETIKFGLEDAIEKNNKVANQGNTPAIIRPWYQDFTATWVKGHIDYGAEEVLEQIKAGKDLGINEYLIWNPRNTYSERAWLNTNNK
ncbi:GTP-binding protein [Vulcanibacillus modesticaldus]|uniref:GTP-binding protein n=1 Tax=Vulcanibacillus modesticaldus TaxID=337097 RepID=A0A1D2YVG9_9BACI|nr:GTP-binding protein [Vulcanibacillus modesticaldus]